MHILRYSDKLNRMIRQDTPEDLGKPTRPIVEQVMQEGRVEDAKQWLDYLFQEIAGIQYLLSVWSWYMVQYILERNTEYSLELILKESMAPWIGVSAGLREQQVASVKIGDDLAKLDVRGLNWRIYLRQVEKRFFLTLDTPQAQDVRRSEWQLAIHDAMDAGHFEQFKLLLDQRMAEELIIHDILCDWVWALMTLIAREWGEASLGDVQRATEEPWIKVRYEKIRDITPEESLQLSVEAHRGHLAGPRRDGSVRVIEERERYIIHLEQCGSGSRMTRGDPIVGNGSRLEPPFNFINIQGAYAWTWFRNDVCGYCTHCAIVNQILPIEWLGRPMRGTRYPDHPNLPCEWYIYKTPEAVPDEAYTSVGKKPPERKK